MHTPANHRHLLHRLPYRRRSQRQKVNLPLQIRLEQSIQRRVGKCNHPQRLTFNARSYIIQLRLFSTARAAAQNLLARSCQNTLP
jgi:hypothetical protein